MRVGRSANGSTMISAAARSAWPSTGVSTASTISPLRLHQGMSHEAQRGPDAGAFLVELRRRVRRRGVRVVGAPLAPEVYLDVAAAVTGWGWRAIVFRPHALHRRPGLNQRAVDAEVVVRQKPLHPRLRQNRRQELARHVALKQPVTILRKRRGVPNRRIHRQSDEPAEQQIIVELLHQLPLRPHRKERLQQQRLQQLLRRDRGTTGMRIKRGEPGTHPGQNLIDQCTDRPQRMILRNAILQPNIAEHPVRSFFPASHRKSPPSSRPQQRNHQIDPNARLFFSALLGMVFTHIYADAERISL